MISQNMNWSIVYEKSNHDLNRLDEEENDGETKNYYQSLKL
jgi:hypothetical protein